MDVVTIERPTDLWYRFPAAAAVGAPRRFFTLWVLTLWLVRAPTALLRPLAILVAVGGAYLVHVHPRALRIPADRGGVVVRGPALWLTDLVFHVLPLLLLLRVPSSRRGTCAAVLLLAAYMVCWDVRDTYGLRPVDVVLLGAAMAAALHRENS